MRLSIKSYILRKNRRIERKKCEISVVYIVLKKIDFHDKIALHIKMEKCNHIRYCRVKIKQGYFNRRSKELIMGASIMKKEYSSPEVSITLLDLDGKDICAASPGTLESGEHEVEDQWWLIHENEGGWWN